MKLVNQLARAESRWLNARAQIAEDRAARRSTYRAEKAFRDATNEILRLKLKIGKRNAASVAA